jgi:hypothetical protein
MIKMTQSIDGVVLTSAQSITANLINPSQTIVSVNIINGKLEVVRRIPSNTCLAVWRSDGQFVKTPDTIFKDIYTAKDGQIILEKTIQADVTPSQVIPESVHFPE